jgi:hypothetical protein
MGYGLLADLMVAIHFAYVCFVVFGQLFILIGWILRWDSVRNIFFRSLHLLAISIVALEELFHVTCPLTMWENQFRELAGQEFNGSETFMGRLLHNAIFYTPPNPVFFTWLYVGFALLVLLTFVLCPPRLRRRRKEQHNAGGPLAGPRRTINQPL